MAKDPAIFYPYNYCHNCKTNSIEIYSWHNYPQKYQKLLDQYQLNGAIPPSLDKYGIFTMRCSRCGREYKMVWENGIPRPIHDNFDSDLFMETFKAQSILGRPDITTNVYEEKLK